MWFYGKNTETGLCKKILLGYGDLIEHTELRGHLCEIIGFKKEVIVCQNCVGEKYGITTNKIVLCIPKDEILKNQYIKEKINEKLD